VAGRITGDTLLDSLDATSISRHSFGTSQFGEETLLSTKVVSLFTCQKLFRSSMQLSFENLDLRLGVLLLVVKIGAGLFCNSGLEAGKSTLTSASDISRILHVTRVIRMYVLMARDTVVEGSGPAKSSAARTAAARGAGSRRCRSVPCNVWRIFCAVSEGTMA